MFAGKQYYSPNCTRDHVLLPMALADVPKNIFLPEIQFKPAQKNKPRVSYYDFSRVFVEDFQFPRWWTERWGWTAFIVRMPDFKGAGGIFYPLGERIRLQRKEGGWELSDVLLARLCALETEIITAVHRLAALTGSTIVYPPPPRAFGYQKWYKGVGNATTCVERSRKWFLVWMGLFSYLIAVAETKEQSLQAYPNLRIAAWTTHLRDNGFHQAWIDDILSSVVCSFDLRTPRAGIFINLRPGQSNQPSLDWYCEYGIPVWYELTKDSPALPDKFSPGLHSSLSAVFTTSGPQPHSPDARKSATDSPLSLSAGFPLVISESYTGTQSAPTASSPMSVDANSEWKAFFAARESQNASIIAKEDQLQRQRRLSRAKTPATKSAKVFEWLEDNNGVYRRQAVLGKYKLDTFEGYTKNQLRYDAVWNEWDCCVAFALHQSNLDDDDDSDFDMYASPHKASVIDINDQPHVVLEEKGSPSTKTRPNDSELPLDHNDNLEPVGPFNAGDTPNAPPDWMVPESLVRDELRRDYIRASDQEPVDVLNASDTHFATQDEISSEPLVQEPSSLWSARRPTVLHDEAAEWIPHSLPSIISAGSGSATPAEHFEEEILRRGYLRYGFAPRGTSESQKIPAFRDEREEKNLMQVLGFCWYADHANAFKRETIAYFADFLDRLGKKATISNFDWDMGESHINSVALLPRFSTIRIMTVSPGNAKLYMFERDSRSSVRWNLAMTTAAQALMVCRLDMKWDILDVAQYLVWNGIPFRTLQRSDSIQRAPLIDSRPLHRHPVRPTGYEFTTDDYKSYRDRCDQILQTHRGRVALMMGGHLWRIAVNIVSLADTLRGPSGWYLDSSKMLVATDPLTGEEFIDDQFMESEIESLCGMNLYLTGRFAFSSVII